MLRAQTVVLFDDCGNQITQSTYRCRDPFISNFLLFRGSYRNTSVIFRVCSKFPTKREPELRWNHLATLLTDTLGKVTEVVIQHDGGGALSVVGRYQNALVSTWWTMLFRRMFILKPKKYASIADMFDEANPNALSAFRSQYDYKCLRDGFPHFLTLWAASSEHERDALVQSCAYNHGLISGMEMIRYRLANQGEQQ